MSSEEREKACSGQPETYCVECNVKGQLLCRFDWKEWLFFVLSLIPFLFSAFFGLVLTGIHLQQWWWLIVYAIFVFILWGIGVQSFILSRHNPQYSAEGKMIKCIHHAGLPKIFKFSPGPLEIWEKIITIIAFVILFTFPILGESYALGVFNEELFTYSQDLRTSMIGIIISTILTGAQFFLLLQIHFCKRCVNLSCPFNQVSKEVVDEFIKNNPEMESIWKEKGFTYGKKKKKTKKKPKKKAKKKKTKKKAKKKK